MALVRLEICLYSLEVVISSNNNKNETKFIF